MVKIIAGYYFEMNLLSFFQSSGNKFYSLFENAAENNVKAATLLLKLCQENNSTTILTKIHDLEHQNDKLVHAIYDTLTSVFVTPWDREDIISLTNTLDDVTDLIHESADYLVNYNIKKVSPIALELAKVILASTKEITDVLPKLRHRRTFKTIHKSIVEINKLENEADDLLHKGLKELFKNPKDPVDVIRWRDIYHTMEEVTDKTEDIGDVLSRLIAKYG